MSTQTQAPSSVNASMHAPSSRGTGSDSTWRRSSDQGTASRGAPRGRGGSNADRGGKSNLLRGGRGSRSRGGKSEYDTSKSEPTPVVSTAASLSSKGSAPPPVPPIPGQGKSTAAPSTRAPRPKGPSRRGSRNVASATATDTPPSPNPDAAPATVNTTAPTSNHSSSNRRSKRGSNRVPNGTGDSSKVDNASTKKNTLSVSSAPPRGRARTDPPTPIVVVNQTSKDAPPHLSPAPSTPSFDIKHNIDLLVERVRAVAIRPNTPGSHIDWAEEEEDESLPDLDDWGVTSTTLSVPHTDISPIAEDPPVTLLNALQGGIVPTSDDTDPKEDSGVRNKTREEVNSKAEESTTPESHNSPSQDESVGDNSYAPQDTKSTETNASRKVFLHPSLPPKPISVAETPKIRNDLAAVPMRARSPSPLKPRSAEETLPSVDQSSSANSESDNLSLGTAASMHAIKAPEALAANFVTPTKAEAPAAVGEGLASSIHAPSSNHVDPSNQPSFQPTHARASTVGRPARKQESPRSPPGNKAHARTHSSPPVGHRIPHSRPILTGDALNRLARSIGGGVNGMPTSKSTPAVAKE